MKRNELKINWNPPEFTIWDEQSSLTVVYYSEQFDACDEKRQRNVELPLGSNVAETFMWIYIYI